MSYVTQTPVDPVVAAADPSVTSGLASAFRGKINTAYSDLMTRLKLIMAAVENIGTQVGAGAISGGAVTAGSGLSVSVATLKAFVGSVVEFNASQTVGGFTGSATNYLYLRQDGTWTINTTGTAPGTGDGHGLSLLWATVVCGASTVTSIGDTRRLYPFDAPSGVTYISKLQGNGAAMTFKRRAIALSDADTTLLASQYDATILEFTGALTADRFITMPTTDGAAFMVRNKTSGAHKLKFVTASYSQYISVDSNLAVWIYCDGADYQSGTPTSGLTISATPP